MGPDYLGLLAGYVAAAGAFWVLFLAAPGIMQAHPVQFQRPWLELALLAIGVAGVIGVGQLFQARMLLPNEGVLYRSVNQILIFAPAVVVLVFLRPFWPKNFLSLDRAASGLGLGLVLALLAFTAFIAASRGIGAWPDAAAQILTGDFPARPGVDSISIVVQVALEDLLIAALAARLTAATNVWVAIGVTAALFAAGHIPAMLADGATLTELWTLVLDTGLGVLVVGAIIVSRNVWWFIPVHSVMDLTQFLTP
jgi:hypothetical protein